MSKDLSPTLRGIVRRIWLQQTIKYHRLFTKKMWYTLSKKSHEYNGKEKHPYYSKHDIELACKHLEKKTGQKYWWYKCFWCTAWHIAKDHTYNKL